MRLICALRTEKKKSRTNDRVEEKTTSWIMNKAKWDEMRQRNNFMFFWFHLLGKFLGSQLSLAFFAMDRIELKRKSDECFIYECVKNFLRIVSRLVSRGEQFGPRQMITCRFVFKRKAPMVKYIWNISQNKIEKLLFSYWQKKSFIESISFVAIVSNEK